MHTLYNQQILYILLHCLGILPLHIDCIQSMLSSAPA